LSDFPLFFVFFIKVASLAQKCNENPPIHSLAVRDAWLGGGYLAKMLQGHLENSATNAKLLMKTSYADEGQGSSEA
jgi:hypothetical protein